MPEHFKYWGARLRHTTNPKWHPRWEVCVTDGEYSDHDKSSVHAMVLAKYGKDVVIDHIVGPMDTAPAVFAEIETAEESYGDA